MAGDDLTIALFILSIAFGAMYAAVTIHGWKHRALLVALWVLAFTGFVLGFGWPWIKNVSPAPFVALLSEIVTRPLSYTILALVLAVMFEVRQKYLPPSRAKDHSAIPQGRWISPETAVERFLDSELVLRYRMALEHREKCNALTLAAHRELEAIPDRKGPSSMMSTPVPAAVTAARLKHRNAFETYEIARADASNMLEKVKSSLTQKLRDNEIRARGILPPLEHSSIPLVIPSHLWPNLQFEDDLCSVQAKQKTMGPNLSYINLEFNKP